ncbi:CapA family protein [Pseudolactococcus plantarum]|uniref:Capsule synthesis protein CapA domain-containing protein n=1 Tax=Pseudolactococcus plantarum TaxID=1365 RepID=A0A2A5RZ43_9LACT|nr:CapA family protein [Lactococcus plantarum]PCS06485.1 hypothetical protein RU87_GL001694 [Lactococcus plantarum]HCN74303.1 CapA family protein [Lactococcus sp.]
MQLIVAGDLLFSSRNLKETIDPKLVELLQSADAVLANAEFVTPKKDTPPAAGRGYVTAVRPETLDEFTDLNMKYLSFANNHTGDFGITGMLDTLAEARSRGLHPLGLGESLFDARKPQFIDTRDGRIAIITVAVTRSEVFAASNAGNGVPARPGVNPLRWERSYVLPKPAFEALAEIDHKLGTRASSEQGSRVETWSGPDDSAFKFGSLWQEHVSIELGEDYAVRTKANEQDQADILADIADAKNRADYVFVNFHAHEGLNEDWYADEPAAFIEKFAKSAIDHGADAVIGHGAHFLKGIALHQGKPIFYNIHSLVMEFESGESIIPPEMYEAYGYPTNSKPSTLHANRAKDKAGNWQGFNAEDRFSQSVLISFDLNADQETFDYHLIPIDLQLTHDRPSKRGRPKLADPETVTAIQERVSQISQVDGVALIEADGVLKVKQTPLSN